MDGELRVLSGRVTQVFLEVVYRYQRYPQFIVQTKRMISLSRLKCPNEETKLL